MACTVNKGAGESDVEERNYQHSKTEAPSSLFSFQSLCVFVGREDFLFSFQENEFT